MSAQENGDQHIPAPVRDALRVAVVAVLSVGNPHDPAARATAAAVIREAGLTTYTVESLDFDLRNDAVAQVRAFMEPLVGTLPAGGRSWLVGRLAAVAAADSAITQRQAAVLEQVGSSLQMDIDQIAHAVAASAGGVPGPTSVSAGPSSTASPSSAADPAPTPSVGRPAEQLPPAGWYPDGPGSPRQRWWDGANWTDHWA